MDIIGRKREKKLIESSLYSDKSALIVVYGRRRVGKTFLIRETCKNYLRFEFVGMHKATAKDQLRLFSMTLRNYTKIKQKIPANWLEAFQQLKEYCDSWKGNKKKVLLLSSSATEHNFFDRKLFFLKIGNRCKELYSLHIPCTPSFSKR
ncbi:MAG: hypothetical protein EBS17_08060 [Flavobacteriia bacterium]|nr:hypothetical protein [Flavobacteriia bacterium]